MKPFFVLLILTFFSAGGPEYAQQGCLHLRLAQERSWTMWFLCCAIAILIGRSLQKTRPFDPDGQGRQTGVSLFYDPETTSAGLVVKSLLLAGVVFAVCVIIAAVKDRIPSISGITLSFS